MTKSPRPLLGTLALLTLVGSATGCSSDRAGTLARSPLDCAIGLGESLTDVRTWLGIATDGSKDSSVRVVNLTKASGPSLFKFSTGIDLVCGSRYADQPDPTAAGPDEAFLRRGDVMLGGDGNDNLPFVLGGMFRGGLGVDSTGALNQGTFDGGAGDDQINDGFPAGLFLGGDGNDVAYAMSGGSFDGGAGTDSAELYYSGTLKGVESCRLDTMEPCP